VFYKTHTIVFNEYEINRIEIGKHRTFFPHVKFELQLGRDMKKKSAKV
jgi:hypothetical protein